MQRAAARKIDEAIGKALSGDKPRAEPSDENECLDKLAELIKEVQAERKAKKQSA